ncbi:MAG: response regulator [Oscillospiraceae bacterium]|jgi:signal transduction histidine kinase/CheY-like chemotaxis protein|nr:response regulator [Oscillospiraceae bacterium]
MSDKTSNTEEMLEQILKLCATFVWEWNLAKDELRIYLGSFDAYGFTPDIVNGKLDYIVNKIVHPDDIDNFNNSLKTFIEANRRDIFKVKLRIRNFVTDSWIWHENFGFPINNEDTGEITVFHGGLINIDSDVKEKEVLSNRILSEQHTTYELFNNNPYPCFMLDDRFNVINCNQAIVKTFGFKDVEDAKKNLVHIIDNSSVNVQKSGRPVKSVAERLIGVMKNGYDRDETILIANGKKFIFDVTYIRISLGDSFGIVCYGINVTELRGALEAAENALSELEKSRKFQDIIFNANSQSAFLFNDKLELISVNPAALKVFGYPDEKAAIERWPKEIDSQFKTKQYDGHTVVPPWERFRQVLQTGFAHAESTLEINGKTVIMDTLFIRVPFGNSHGIAMYATDITNLRIAVNDALVATKAKSDFLSHMSHEIRTPLNAVIGMTAIGSAADEIAKKDYAFEKIKEASVHLLGIINDILDISKIEADKLELSEAEFNIERVVRKISDLFEFKFREKDIAFSYKIDDKLPRFFIGDEQRFTQVIVNLVSNAVKFTEEGGTVGLAIDFSGEENGKTVLTATITDTGIGIEKPKLENIFRAFEQADNSISRKYGGTGLGLAISNKIAELMRGGLSVKSELGKGSTFVFTSKLQSVRHSATDLIKANAGDLKILAVDDEKEMLQYFLEIAKELRLNISVASSAKSAIEAVETNGHYDLYFIDWRMPGINGIQLAEKLQKDSASSIIIMVTAADLSEVESDANAVGVRKILSKPIFSSDIADCINEFVIQPNNQKCLDSADFAGKKILIAEDVDINQVVVGALLEETGVEIDFANNGVEAVAMFEIGFEKYDMILMDVHMPELDGLGATRQIRAMPFQKAQSIPIVAMTANVFREDVEKCLASGMNDHIGKPIDLQIFLSKMKKYIN